MQPKQWLSHTIGAPVSSSSEATSNTVSGPAARPGSLRSYTLLMKPS